MILKVEKDVLPRVRIYGEKNIFIKVEWGNVDVFLSTIEILWPILGVNGLTSGLVHTPSFQKKKNRRLSRSLSLVSYKKQVFIYTSLNDSKKIILPLIFKTVMIHIKRPDERTLLFTHFIRSDSLAALFSLIHSFPCFSKASAAALHACARTLCVPLASYSSPSLTLLQLPSL